MQRLSLLRSEDDIVMKYILSCCQDLISSTDLSVLQGFTKKFLPPKFERERDNSKKNFSKAAGLMKYIAIVSENLFVFSFNHSSPRSFEVCL